MSRTIPQIIAEWPNCAVLARRLGRKPVVVQRWLSRGRIPGENDADLVRIAKEDGINLSFEDLAQARALSNAYQIGTRGRVRQDAKASQRLPAKRSSRSRQGCRVTDLADR